MRIHEICKRCSLTRKAVQYYVEKGLIAPTTLENGYRDFTEDDARRLDKIAVLRGLGFSTEDIRAVLADENGAALQTAIRRQRERLEEQWERQALANRLAREGDWKEARARLAQLDRRRAVRERLLEAFPGAYGRYFALHFAQFLNEPAQTPEQEQAYETALAFLDGAQLKLPRELQACLEQAGDAVSDEDWQELHDGLIRLAEHPKDYLEAHREQLEQYLAFRKTDEYKASPMYQLQTLMREWTEQSGYNDVFLPAMRALSPAYRAYSEQLLRANEAFLRAYPSAGHE